MVLGGVSHGFLRFSHVSMGSSHGFMGCLCIFGGLLIDLWDSP